MRSTVQKAMRNCIPGVLLLATLSFATNYYVSGTGSDTRDGLTSTTAYATLSKAANKTLPGDTVYIMNGTYPGYFNITRPGTRDKWIVYIAFAGHQPLFSFNVWYAIKVLDSAAYIEINGMTIRGNSATINLTDALNQPGGCVNSSGAIDPRFNGTGIAVEGRSSQSKGHPHHIRIVNNTIYECSGGGISAIQADYVTLERNIVYSTCWYTLYGASGISCYQNWRSDTVTGYKFFIRGNRCFRNRLYVPWVDAPCEFTDGNGIIIDDSKNTQNGSTLGAYTGRTLVANNLVFNNGGTGIHTFQSEHVDIVNNTSYHNSQSVEIDNGEIIANSSNDIKIINNILWADSGNKVTINPNNTNLSYENNLIYGGTSAAIVGTNAVRVDPLFAHADSNPATADFHLTSASPAIDKGRTFAAVSDDFDGIGRPQKTHYDIGAFEYPGSSIARPAAVRYPEVSSHGETLFDCAGRSVAKRDRDGVYIMRKREGGMVATRATFIGAR